MPRPDLPIYFVSLVSFVVKVFSDFLSGNTFSDHPITATTGLPYLPCG